MSMKSRGPILDSLDKIEAICEVRDPSLQEILEIFGPNGHWILTGFMIIPFLQPVPMVGLSTPFGLGICVVSILYYRNRPPWLPSRITQKKLPAKTIDGIAQGAERLLEKISPWVYPRLKTMFESQFRFWNLIVVVTSAVLLALPIPIPFSNALPGWAIFFQALGHLERDGVFVILSYVQFLVCLTTFYLLGTGIKLGIQNLFPNL
jgi:hypothetical protein